jgi:hypothetical protein
MWLREVHNRLVEGTYDNEFDFAWDVRLIFQNCCEYNERNSELYNAAKECLEYFDYVMCLWIHNIQDKSVDDNAKGAWDDWKRLRYFDADESTANVCCISGVKADESELLVCKVCEDQYLPSAVGIDVTDTVMSSDWYCPRCVRRDAMGLNPLNINFNSLNSMHSKIKTPYCRDEYGGNTYQPCTDYGPGWCQARRNNRQGLKHTFLSPLGYVVYSKDEVLLQKEFEETVNANLMKSRAEEFKEQLTSSRRKKGQSMRHKRDSDKRETTNKILTRRRSSDNENVEAITSNKKQKVTEKTPSPNVAAQDEDKITIGKLCNMNLEADYKFLWVVDRIPPNDTALRDKPDNRPISQRNQIGNKFILTQDMLPPSGLFGLDCSDIRRCIEALNPSPMNICSGYISDNAELARQEIITELSTDINKKKIHSLAQQKLEKKILEERWQFERTCRDQRDVKYHPSLKALALQGLLIEGFADLFPSSLKTDQAEVLLALWDFLDSTRVINGEPMLSLYELIESVLPLPHANCSSRGQVVFDEIGCVLSGMLFKESRYAFLKINEITSSINTWNTAFDDIEWHKFSLSNPINVITWPHIASLMINAFSLVNSPVVPMTLFESDMTACRKHVFKLIHLQSSVVCSPMGDIMTLLLTHPLLPFFMGNSSAVANNEQYLKLKLIRQKYINLGQESELNSGNVYSSVYQLTEDMLMMFSSIFKSLSVHDSSALFAVQKVKLWAAQELYNWSLRLFVCMGLTVYENYESLSLMKDCPVKPLDNSSKCDPFLAGVSFDPFNFDTSNPLYTYKDGYVLFSDIEFEANAIDLKGLNSKLKIHSTLEMTLISLRTSEPEQWDLNRKVMVYATLVDQCSRTNMFQQIVRLSLGQRKATQNPYSTMADVTNQPSIGSHLESVKLYPDQVLVCHYSGVKSTDIDSPVKWVYVPEWLKNPPPPYRQNLKTVELFDPYLSNTNTDGKRDVALESAVLLVIAAREAAVKERLRVEDRLVDLNRKVLSSEFPPLLPRDSVTETWRVHCLTKRCVALGYDRTGREYWLLGVQENAPLEPIGSTLFSLGPSQKMDPSILMRERLASGEVKWKYYHGSVEKILSSFNPMFECERILRFNMIQRLWLARRKLYSGTLRLKIGQQEWLKYLRFFLQKVSRIVPIAESLSSTFLAPNIRDMAVDICIAANDEKMNDVRTLEMLYGRCVEKRVLLHYTNMHRDDESASDKIQKSDKESMLKRQMALKGILNDDVFDLNPSKGYIRGDLFTRIRDLSASTTASRLLADPSVYRLFQALVKRSISRTALANEANVYSQHNDIARVFSIPSAIQQLLKSFSDSSYAPQHDGNHLADAMIVHHMELDQQREVADMGVKMNERHDLLSASSSGYNHSFETNSEWKPELSGK